MEQLEYKIEILASPDKIWTVLWGEITYRQWTTAFTEGSFYIGDFEEGSIMKFMDPKNNGMFSRVTKNVTNETMTFHHLGEIYDGVEVPQDWGDASETYSLSETENGTQLTIKANTPEEFVSFFEENIPKAIHIIKNLSENQF